MNPALSLVNQKLYHASLHLGLLRGELERQDIPAAVLLEAIGQSVQFHLRLAYGAFLLVLAGGEPDGEPLPGTVEEATARYGLEQPLRGELQELAALERGDSWLAALLRGGEVRDFGDSLRGSADSLAVEQGGYSEAQLREWHTALADLIDRMADSLDEW